MNFFDFARRMAKKTSSSARMMSATRGWKITPLAHTISAAANAAEATSDALLPALKNPTRPPAISSTMYIQRTVVGFIMCQENSVIFRQAQGENRAGLALGDHFKWPATNFAVGGESLRGDAAVDDQFDALAAERALKGHADFHTLATHLRKCAQSQSRRKTRSRATPQRPHA